MTGSDRADGATRSTRRRMLREAARASDSYGLLFVLVIIDYIVLSVGWTTGTPLILSTGLIALTAILAFHTSHVRGHFLTAVQVAAVIAFVASIAVTVVGGNPAKGAVFIIGALLILTSPIVVLSRILRHRQVTAETLLGAICVYILLGLVFSYADYAVQLIGGRFFAQPGTQGAPAFVYYSFITMTTVGYGDLTPSVGLPRTMAVLEALTGQVFLVVLVARLVSMYKPGPLGARRRALDEGMSHRDTGVEIQPGSGATFDEE